MSQHQPESTGGEVFDLMRMLRSLPDEEYLQLLIAYHAAPTLQGIKPASLVCPSRNERDLGDALSAVNARLAREFGVKVAALGRRSRAVPLLVYSPMLLGAALYSGEVPALLKEWGYDLSSPDVEKIIASLGEKFTCDPFPHEIGVFLGYPARDVREFMRNNGRGSICTGCWRVYGDRGEAESRFASFRRAKRRAAELIIGGASLGELAAGLRIGA